MNTRLLFLALLRDLEIDTVCDVGSMNGADAMAFRARLPNARVTAFEPNPENLREMEINARLQHSGVEIVSAAISNEDGVAPFFLVPAKYDHDDPHRGMSSLHSRSYVSKQTQVEVHTLRLDTFLAPRCADDARVALWIDSEGYAFEVLDGARGIAEKIQMLHVEVESEPCINANQYLYSQVKSLLESLGLVQIAIDQPPERPQFNALFVRDGQSAKVCRHIRYRLVIARVRALCVRTLRAFCPACAKRLANMWRRRTTSS